jgi:hypothetical protein
MHINVSKNGILANSTAVLPTFPLSMVIRFFLSGIGGDAK